jgi:hypothetical protein
MTSDQPTCPFCNAEVELPAGLPAGARVSCPRCGETYALREPTPGSPRPAGMQLRPAAPAEGAPPDLRRANRRVAGLVVGVMVLMAAGGLALALFTQGYRRANDRGLVKRRSRRPALPPEDAPAVQPVPPARLAALGYLPDGTNAVIGVHVAELLASPAGKGLLDTTLQLGNYDVRLSRLKGWTGLALEDLDHVVLGVKADDQLLPLGVLVVRTRQPYDRAEVCKALDARERPRGGKTLYSFKPASAPDWLTLFMWCADERTILIGYRLEHFASLPDKPVPGAEALAEPVRAVVEKRMSPGGPLWGAVHTTDWTQGVLNILVGALGIKDRDAERLARTRTLALWVQAEPQLTVRGVCAAPDEESARLLEERYLVPWQKKGRGLTFARDKQWLTVQWKTDLARLRKALGK